MVDHVDHDANAGCNIHCVWLHRDIPHRRMTWVSPICAVVVVHSELRVDETDFPLDDNIVDVDVEGIDVDGELVVDDDEKGDFEAEA